MHVPGMSVHTPKDVQGQIMKAPNGQEFFVLPQISILPKQRMVMSIDGLPRRARLADVGAAHRRHLRRCS